MIRLYQFAPAFGLPNASPFCMKLETYLRMAGLEFEIVRGASLFGAPKGKMPYIEDRGRRIGDSSLIIEYLKSTYGDPLDAWLSAGERALALAFQRLMEENLYWALLHTRWIAPDGFAKTRAAFFGHLPPPLKWLVPHLARRAVARELHGHGMGRHSEDEIHAIGRRDIGALAEFLGAKAYFMGERPCSLDATAYAFLANLIWVPVESALTRHARQFAQFESYCARMRERYYGGDAPSPALAPASA
jgi:glutathione S-transferase